MKTLEQKFNSMIYAYGGADITRVRIMTEWREHFRSELEQEFKSLYNTLSVNQMLFAFGINHRVFYELVHKYGLEKKPTVANPLEYSAHIRHIVFDSQTGVFFDSVNHAAKAFGISYGAMENRIKKNQWRGNKARFIDIGVARDVYNSNLVNHGY